MPALRVPLRPLAAAAALLALAGAAGAQPAPRDTTPVPRELVELLFGRYGVGMRDIVVGRAPSGLPAEAAPAHLRAVGGMGGPMGGEAIYEVAGEPGGLAARHLAALEARGWEPFRPRAFGTVRGFVPSESYGGAPPNQLCRDRSTLTVVPHRQFDRSYLRVSWSVGERSMCRMMAERSEGQRQMEQRYAEVPVLAPPADVEVRSRGMSTSGEDWSVSALATGDRTAAQLLDHYAAAMTAAGWTQAARHGDAALTVATFTKPDTTDGAASSSASPGAQRSWYALLTVVAEPGQARTHALDLRARRAGSR